MFVIRFSITIYFTFGIWLLAVCEIGDVSSNAQTFFYLLDISGKMLSLFTGK